MVKVAKPAASRAAPVRRVSPTAILQPALKVGPANDPLEREADAMADRVAAMAAPAFGEQLAEPSPNGVAEGGAGGADASAVRRAMVAEVGSAGGPAPADVAALVAKPGAGRALPASARA